MKVTTEASLRDFEAWSGAISTKEAIIEAGKDEDFEAYIEEMHPDGVDETTLNDLLWFEKDYLFEILGINQEEEND